MLVQIAAELAHDEPDAKKSVREAVNSDLLEVEAYLAVGMISFWVLSYAAGLKPLGANPVPNFWGMVIATVALAQLGVGIWLDRHYNRGVGRFYLWAAMYPLFYWMVMLVVTVTVPLMLAPASESWSILAA